MLSRPSNTQTFGAEDERGRGTRPAWGGAVGTVHRGKIEAAEKDNFSIGRIRGVATKKPLPSRSGPAGLAVTLSLFLVPGFRSRDQTLRGQFLL